ncbi:MAG TPA: DUF1385 domain-containing protein [Chthonomonadales bacterium]|nr:DUF1385 domain-containing protein [Chthonomonadales bacterium]
MSNYLQYGGQAVIEGVMMRSPRFVAVACRRPDSSIVVLNERVENAIMGRLKWLNRPLLRGSLALVDAVVLGTKALAFAANVQATALDEAKRKFPGDVIPENESVGNSTLPASTTFASEPSSGIPRSRVNDIAIGGTIALAFCFGLGLFIALPTVLTQLSQNPLGVTSDVGRNLIDGIIRIGIFIGYIALISQMENIRRVFQYHGAEHKAINTLEAGEELTVENSLRASRIHPRCGTSFIVVVLLASILVHCLFPRPENYFVRVALHLALIPIVAGVAYEVIKLAGRYRNVLWTRILLAPGLWSQQLTTREPNPDQVEVALVALKSVLSREEAEREMEAA